MSENSTTGYKVVIALLAAALLVVGALGLTKKGGDEDLNAALKNLKQGLDDCTTQRSDLKDRVARLEADLKRAQEQGANVPACVPGSTISAGRSAGDGKIGLTVDQIRKVTTQTGGLKMCYERALKRDST